MSGDRVVDYPIFAGASDMRGRWRGINKAAGTPMAADAFEMALVHGAFRRELHNAPGLTVAVPAGNSGRGRSDLAEASWASPHWWPGTPSPRSNNSGFDATNTSLTKSATSFRSSTATSHLASDGNSRVSSSTACQPRTDGAFLPMCCRHNASRSSCSAAAPARPTGASCTAHPSQPNRWASGCGSAGTNGIATRGKSAHTANATG
jgi:hypothetical protein